MIGLNCSKRVMKNGGNSFLLVKLVKHKEILWEVPVPGRRILYGKGQMRFALWTGTPWLFLSHCWLLRCSFPHAAAVGHNVWKWTLENVQTVEEICRGAGGNQEVGFILSSLAIQKLVIAAKAIVQYPSMTKGLNEQLCESYSFHLCQLS